MHLQQWLWPQRFAAGCQNSWIKDSFTRTGPVAIHHQVEVATQLSTSLLSQGIDGFHEWYWGEGWVQSRLEGVSILPNLGQTLNLLRLRQF